MFKFLNLFKRPKSKWTKIEDGSYNEWSWTDYTDFKGYTYRIYNLIPQSPTPNAYVTKIDE